MWEELSINHFIRQVALKKEVSALVSFLSFNCSATSVAKVSLSST